MSRRSITRQRTGWVAVVTVVAALTGLTPGTAASAATPVYDVICQAALSGGNAYSGVSMCDGVVLAVADINGSRRLPYKLRVVRYDDQGTSALSRQVAARVAADPRAIGVIGPEFSGAAKAAANTYAHKHLLAATPCATQDDVTQLGASSATTFRTVATDGDEGHADARYVISKHLARVAIASDGSDYATAVAGAAFRTLSGKETVTGRYAIATTEQAETAANAIEASSIDAVVATGYDSTVGQLVRKLREDGVSAPVITDDGARYPGFFAAAGSVAAAEGVVASSPYFASQHSARGRSFARHFQDAFHQLPAVCAAEAYDTTRALGVALRLVGSKPTHRAVVRAFAHVDCRGITKRIRFHSTHELISPPVFWYVSDGQTFTQT